MTKLSVLAGAAVLAAASLAHAYPDPFTSIAMPSPLRSFVPIDEQGLVGVISTHADGSIWNHVLSNPPVGYRLRIAPSWGVSAVIDTSDTTSGAPAVYVISAELDGLYYLRVTNRGATWDDAWCHVDTRNDLQSAPSAVHIANGNIRVYARTSTSHLVEWRITPPAMANGRCQHVVGTVFNELIQTAPVAVSWAPTYAGSFGRIDVFATTTQNKVIHWWKGEQADDTTQSQLSPGELGLPHVIFVQAGTPVLASAMSKGLPNTMGLDVLYRGPSGAPYHLEWRATSGWWDQNQNPVLASSVDVIDLATTWDPFGGLAWIAHGCFNAPPGQNCRAAGWTDDARLIGNQAQVFATTLASAVRSYTDGSGFRYLFVGDAGTGNLWWTRGYFTNAY